LEELAPIVLFVYNRPEHTRKTVESLLKNALAGMSEIFIYSDGPKSEKDNDRIKSVRNYIHEISGFKQVKIIEREKNLGLAKSVITGVSDVFSSFEKVIVMEDDIVTSPSFLLFINEALKYYEYNKKIFSVSGYTYPITFSQSYFHDVFISYRPSSWGWGTWKDRWKKVDWEIKDYKSFQSDKNAQISFNKAGEDLIPMLYAQMKGKIDSWAIRWAYSHFRNYAYCLSPVKSLCKNIGTDSSGTHSATTKKYEVELYKNMGEIKFVDKLEVDEEIIMNIRKLVQPSAFRRMINVFKSI